MKIPMMTIEEEIEHFVTFLSHPAGFNVDWAAHIGIRGIDECCPPQSWEVSWTEMIDGVSIDSYKEFHSLREAVTCFVEKRHLLLYGLDFEANLWDNEKDE